MRQVGPRRIGYLPLPDALDAVTKMEDAAMIPRAALADTQIDILIAEKVMGEGAYIPLNYSTNIAQAFLMEDMIKLRGLHVPYVSALIRRCILPNHESDVVYMRLPALFTMVHASPRDRCLAALEIISAPVICDKNPGHAGWLGYPTHAPRVPEAR